MKLLTVVFPLYIEGETTWVLMGKQAPGKRMPGVRIGPGGRCEDGEAPLECAVREVKEEIDLNVRADDLRYVGKIIADDRCIYFYTTKLESKVVIEDNSETVDCRWFDITKTEDYIHEMLPGDDVLMREIIKSLRTSEASAEFTIDKSNNKELQEATKHMFGKIS